MSKGSRPRPFSVNFDKFANNFETIFGKNKSNRNSCSCGRSPSGKCVGWHSYSETQYQNALMDYLEKNK